MMAKLPLYALKKEIAIYAKGADEEIKRYSIRLRGLAGKGVKFFGFSRRRGG
jgi:hypothetical protein